MPLCFQCDTDDTSRTTSADILAGKSLSHLSSCPHLPCRSPTGQTIATRSNFSSLLILEMFHEKKEHGIAILDIRNQHGNRAENFPLLWLNFHMKHFVK